MRKELFSMPFYDRMKIYDEVKKHIAGIELGRNRVKAIYEYFEERGAFAQIMRSQLEIDLPEFMAEEFPKGFLPDRAKAVMLEALWNLFYRLEDNYWHEVEDMILCPYSTFPVTPVELQIFHILYQVGNCVDWEGVKNSEKFSL